MAHYAATVLLAGEYRGEDVAERASGTHLESAGPPRGERGASAGAAPGPERDAVGSPPS